MKKLKPILILSLSLLCMSLTSCYVTRTTVGNGPVGKDPNVKEYSRAHQMAVIDGLAAVNQADPAKPADGNYQVITCFNFVDGLITGITGGLFSMHTVKVVVKNK